MGITAAVAAGALAVGATAYQIKNSNDQRDAAEKAANDQSAQEQELQTEAKQKAQDDQAAVSQTEAEQMARKSQAQKAAASQGYSGTILTGGLGVQSAAPTNGKTLLGM